METLGQELKRRREERNIALRDVAEATRLGVRFLHAIEVDDYSSLPGGIYARSFIRAYAKYVGMDEEEAVARYRKQAQDNEPAEPQITFQDFSNEPSSRSLYVWMVVLLAVIVGGSWAALRYIDRKNAPASAANSPAANPPAANTQPPAAVTAAAAASVPTPSPLASAMPTPAPPTTATEQPATNANTAVVQPAVENIDGVTLTLKTSGQSWVSVRADEQANSQMVTIQPGETRDFKATSKMKVTIGNLPAVQILINGQTAKLPSANGLVVTNAIITKDNFHEFVAAANKDAKDVKAAKPAANKLTAGAPPKPAVTPVMKPAAANTAVNQPAVNKPATNPAVKPPVTNPAVKPAANNSTGTATNNTATKPVNPKPNTNTGAAANNTTKPSPKPEGTSGTSTQKTDKPAAGTKPAEKPKPVVKTESKPE